MPARTHLSERSGKHGPIFQEHSCDAFSDRSEHAASQARLPTHYSRMNVVSACDRAQPIKETEDGVCRKRMRVRKGQGQSCDCKSKTVGQEALFRRHLVKKGRGPRTLRSAAPFEIKTRRRPTLPQAHPAVPSAMGPFTSVFGMGTGVASPLWPPGKTGPGRTREKSQRTVWWKNATHRSGSDPTSVSFLKMKSLKRPSLTAD